MLEAVLGAHFKNGQPGYKKFESGEYELVQTNTNILIQPTTYLPRPGMKITMTFIVGQYAGSERCPRSGCTSRSFTQTGTLGWRWYVAYYIHVDEQEAYVWVSQQ
jgi:hypothetical protein